MAELLMWLGKMQLRQSGLEPWLSLYELRGSMLNAELRNMENKMRNRKCGMTLIGRSVKPRDRCHSVYYCNGITTGRAVKCRPAMQKMLLSKNAYRYMSCKKLNAVYLHTCMTDVVCMFCSMHDAKQISLKPYEP